MFHTKERLNFYDCDPAGIIFYANLLRITHTAYEKFLSEISPCRNLFFDEEIVLPIIHSEADFHKPLKAFDEIDIYIIVKKLKESSFELNYKFKILEELYAESETVHVCVNKNSFKKSKLPADLTKSLRQHLTK